MSENPYAPLTQAVVRTLTDKLYEKRKAAALDIEKQVRDLHQSNQLSQLGKLLIVLRDLTLTPNGHTRKGGLIGLAAAAIALGKLSAAGPYTSQLITPVLTCFSDPDLRVRYYACESLYNIVKICKVSALDHFDDLFDTLWKLSADSDQNVRSGAELLDRLLMDIVVSKEDFDVAHLMMLVRDRIYVQTSSNRRFIVSWLNTMLTAPAFSILPYLSEVMDGLFRMLGDAQSGVRDATETVLGQFLKGVKESPATTGEESELEMLINVLIVHAHEQEPPLARKLALCWLYEFVGLYGSRVLPVLSGYLTAILPALDNELLKATMVNAVLLNLVEKEKLGEDGALLNLDAIIEVLLKHVKHEKTATRTAVLHWIRHLHTKLPELVFPHMSRIFPILLSMLSDTCDDVLLLDLHLLSDVCQKKEGGAELEVESLSAEARSQLAGRDLSPYLIKFCVALLDMFRSDVSLLTERGVLIIRQLCLLLSPLHIYRALSILLLEDKDGDFVTRMVAMLHGILLTATELFILRDQLRRLEDKEALEQFECIYRSWAHQPVALIGLCLLSQNYQHATEVALQLANVDVTVDVLVEVDKLVCLIESPILSYVRMDMLDARHQHSLCTTLSALLMLLPQSDAFNTLHKRLQAVPALTTIGHGAPAVKSKVNFAPLFEHFKRVTKEKQEAVRRRHRELLLSSQPAV